MAINTTDQENKSAHTRQSILDSAIELFLKYGVKKVTIDDICNNCNLTKGSFYHHFPTKDHIVTLSINSGLDLYIENNYIQDDSLSLGQQITNLNLCAFEYFKSIGKEMTRASYVSMIDSSVDVRIEGRKYVDHLTYIVRQVNESNSNLSDLSFNEAYIYVVSVFTGIVMKWSSSLDARYEDVKWENLIKKQFEIMFK